MTSSSKRITALAIALTALAAVDARAQETLVVRGLGLGTFGDWNTTGLLGVGVGVNVTDVIQVTFDASRELGRTDPYRRPVAPAGALPVTIVIFEIDSKRLDRVVTGGARFSLPTSHRFRPFAAVHAGLARVTYRYMPDSIENDGSIEWRKVVEGEGGISIRIVNRFAVEMSYHVGAVTRDYSTDLVQSVGLGVAVGF